MVVLGWGGGGKVVVVTAVGSGGGGGDKKGFARLARSWSHEMSPRQFCD